MKRRHRTVGTIALLCGAFGLACSEASEGTREDEASPPEATAEQAYTEEDDEEEALAAVDGTSVLDAWPGELPPYAKDSYLAAMRAPVPSKVARQDTPRFVRQLEVDRDPAGFLGSYQPLGPTKTSTNAFFLPLGTNGRTCFTCHQMDSGMSVSVRNIRARFAKTKGKDPIFAPVDGANCPNQVADRRPWKKWSHWSRYKKWPSRYDAHSLLLEKGLIRIPIPVPANAEYTIEVVKDPTTCNLDPDFNENDNGTRIVSVFRRPLISGNFGPNTGGSPGNFKTNVLAFGPPPPPPLITNIMADGREPTLFTQAIDATLGHAQATKVPTQEQLNQIVAFETNIYNAQLWDDRAGFLESGGATGGPIRLSTHGNDEPALGVPVFDEYDAWANVKGHGAARRQAIARGQQIFHGTGGGPGGTRGTFTISNVAGFNDAIGAPAVPGACATCHNFAHAGTDVLAQSQRDIGTGGQGVAIGGPTLKNDLPIFKLTCPAGSFLWDPNLTTVLTNDPGKALITGRCRDIGARTVPSLRGLASHEPFFIDGSAKTLLDLVNVYDRRFAIGLTAQEKRDLVAFLESL